MSSHGPIQEEQREAMNALAKGIDEILNGKPPPVPQSWEKRWGFVLLSAEFGRIEGGRVNYISNGDRDDMVAMLRELLARFEGQPETGGTA